ncbi:MAG: rod shape-determining protein [Clostridia bacterium]|nr:rod shape-determining protein [Clostridia bacterium]
MIKLAIDLGSCVTKIYRADASNGIVLAEPSCVAVAGEEHEVRAIGKDAKKLIGKTTEWTNIVYPVYEGRIVDKRLAAAMLKEFLSRVGLGSALKRAETVFSVPCGIDNGQLSDYMDLAEECGLKKAHFIEAPYLAALGAGVSFAEEKPVFCIDIGGGVTNVAAVSSGGMIAGLSMNIGGNNMDANILEKLAKTRGLNIGFLTAERIKNEIGSLSPNARGTTVAEGSSATTYLPASVSVQAFEIADCVRVYIDKVLEYSLLVLNKLPAEVAADIHQSGIYLSGGVMKLPFLAEYISKKLEMSAHICEEPHFAVAHGGGVALRDKKLLTKISRALPD